MIVNMLYPVGAFLTGTVLASAYCWYNHPGVIIRYMIRYYMFKCGLSIKYVQAGRYRFCYAEKGQPSTGSLTMLFLHGFSASKDMWLPTLRKLPPEVHVVLVDLPGHGNTTMPSDTDDLSMQRLTEDLHNFVEAVGLKQRGFHLIGTSLGGAIAALYAALYPVGVERLTLSCPAMETPVKTEFMQEIEKGECRLIPDTVEGLKHMMDSCMFHKPKINPQILKGFMQLRQPKNDFYTRLFEDIQKQQRIYHDELFEKLTHIKAPTQIVWGKQDELIHVSGVDELKSKLPNVVQVDVFDQCGHSIHMDCPGRFVKSLLEFRGELHFAINGKYSENHDKQS